MKEIDDIQENIDIQEVDDIQEIEINDEDNKEEKNEKVKEPKKYDGPRQNYTRFCNMGKDCKRGVRCIWAHTLKQLNPIICKWDLSEEGCLRFQKCFFKHKNETLIQYVKRAFPEDLAKLNIHVNNIEPIITKSKDQDQKEEEENSDYDIDEWTREYLKLLQKYKEKFYDPAFEHYTWGEINDFENDTDIH